MRTVLSYGITAVSGRAMDIRVDLLDALDQVTAGELPVWVCNACGLKEEFRRKVRCKREGRGCGRAWADCSGAQRPDQCLPLSTTRIFKGWLLPSVLPDNTTDIMGRVRGRLVASANGCKAELLGGIEGNARNGTTVMESLRLRAVKVGRAGRQATGAARRPALGMVVLAGAGRRRVAYWRPGIHLELVLLPPCPRPRVTTTRWSSRWRAPPSPERWVNGIAWAQVRALRPSLLYWC